jgi:predicted RNA-binding Zn-ribbon protein involved in translation (DUF1610 family)
VSEPVKCERCQVELRFVEELKEYVCSRCGQWWKIPALERDTRSWMYTMPFGAGAI